MKYEDFEGPVEELILIKIKEIEKKEFIEVLNSFEPYRKQPHAVYSPDNIQGFF